jgi:hypothetical protein
MVTMDDLNDTDEQGTTARSFILEGEKGFVMILY